MSHRRRPHGLDPKIASIVKRLHEHYPFLGHDGIAKLLEEEGVEVDSHALRVFMDEHHIKAQPQAEWVNSSDPRRALLMMLGGIPW